MALVGCSECAKEVSDKALACPNCGCPIVAQKSTAQEKEERQSSDALAAELVNKVNAGELSKTDAIIAYKDEKMVGFNEAKKTIEELLPPDAAKPTGTESALGCFVIVILLIVITALFKFGCSISQSSEDIYRKPIASNQDWFSGGTLHDSTLTEWRSATYRNRLATCADFIAGTRKKLGSKSDAQNLESCISEVAASKELSGMSTAEVAVACLQML